MVEGLTGGALDADEGLGPTPITYSYNDALLNGKMTRAELEMVRAEIFGGSGSHAAVGSVPPPKAPSVPPAPAGEDDEARTVVHVGGRVELAQVTRQIDAGDYATALALAERALEQAPEDQAARRYVELCRKMLGRLYLGALGQRGHVPRVAVPASRLPELALDRWAAFVISRVDGESTIEDILDIAGLPRLDTLRILYELVQEGVLSIDERA
jgi:hypothetical protein